MRETRALAGYLVAALAGALVGATIVLSLDAMSSPQRRPPDPPIVVEEPRRPPAHGRIAPSRTVLLVWAPSGGATPGGLPPDAERILERTPGVRDATTVEAGLDWIESSHTVDGALVDHPRAGLAIPVEVAVVEPREYARFVPPSERELVLGLGPGEALLASTAAELRGADEGLSIDLGEENVSVTGVISDVATNGYELLRAGPPPRSWARVDRYLLLHIESRRDRARVERKVAELLGPGRVFRIRARGETPFLRYGDAVLPGMLVKANFGEFAARPLADGRLDIDPAWTNENIASARVPVLGRVTCHRSLFPQLRGALREIANAGLSFAIDPAQYGGCFGPRFVSLDPTGRISHHAWGIAVDINVAENAFGSRPDQDPRIVEIMEKWGFTWGGRWLIPDGMHFEWARFP